ncbi:hypothetical protein GCM10010307_56640 [Streptomyces vastus]|uniref:Uncharacterized protein n=1 Tax=Streptomyces vastus TaxID=285451 RepID=A0ABP6DTH5_9ACTN
MHQRKTNEPAPVLAPTATARAISAHVVVCIPASRVLHNAKRSGLGPWGLPAALGGEWGRAAPVVVHQPFGGSGRQVAVRGKVVGVAHSVADVLAVVRRLGIALGHEEAGVTPLIEWRGGGADAWP